MWAEAAKWLHRFGDVVLTVIDVDGYPASIRVDSRHYDGATGRLPATMPEGLLAVEGPSNLLCHSHDEKMWKLQMVTIKGKLEKASGEWVFCSETFNPPSRLAFVDFIRGARKSAQRYLDKRDLPRPEVNWSAIKDAQRRAKG